uniref:Uncharacterized protein n=1 Tax=Cannabis sativa TaxID=3483 RepID=A0A803PCV4_CANSA
MDFENLLNSSGKKGKKKVASSETSLGENLEPVKRLRKTTASKKCALQQIVIKLANDQVHSPTPTIEGTKEKVLGSVHQVKFWGSEPEMVFLEPSCPLHQDAGITGLRICSQYATSSWRHFKSFQSGDWDLINNDNFEELFEKSLNLSLLENTRLTKDSEELKRNHKAELEDQKKNKALDSEEEEEEQELSKSPTM